MASTAATLLSLLEDVIEKRLQGDAYESYSEAQQEFAGSSLEELFGIRDRLRKEISAGQSSGIKMYLVEPFGS